jgi:hypothetical protein
MATGLPGGSSNLGNVQGARHAGDLLRQSGGSEKSFKKNEKVFGSLKKSITFAAA